MLSLQKYNMGKCKWPNEAQLDLCNKNVNIFVFEVITTKI
jgi:hypothetical protein